jgi:hypothetical protein
LFRTCQITFPKIHKICIIYYRKIGVIVIGYLIHTLPSFQVMLICIFLYFIRIHTKLIKVWCHKNYLFGNIILKEINNISCTFSKWHCNFLAFFALKENQEIKMIVYGNKLRYCFHLVSDTIFIQYLSNICFLWDVKFHPIYLHLPYLKF